MFINTIRDHDLETGGRVTQLEYEADPDAQHALAALTEQATQTTRATIAVSHRFGTLAVGDVAVAVASAAAHRDAALEATDDCGRSGWVGL